MFCKKLIVCLMVLAIGFAMFGCRKKKTPIPDVTAPTAGSLIPEIHRPTSGNVTYTPVYATAFGDTIILATVPVQEWQSLEPDCPPREISNGGRVKCNGEHEKEVPITKVLIVEDLIPRVCSGWFRDMYHLEKIEGIEKLHTHEVSDMSYMFAGCENLTELDTSAWDVSKVKDMTAMFQDCVNLTQLPEWYE